ncbi:hypothetical protein KCP77_02690 [Salmonella enterica subsp. enterica]|nr:hypothetical protein KCP77_02690 [Salmonella enterica subsp. enterica]
MKITYRTGNRVSSQIYRIRFRRPIAQRFRAYRAAVDFSAGAAVPFPLLRRQARLFAYEHQRCIPPMRKSANASNWRTLSAAIRVTREHRGAISSNSIYSAMIGRRSNQYSPFLSVTSAGTHPEGCIAPRRYRLVG